MSFRKMKILALSFVLVAVSGCAAFQEEELARVKELPDTSQYKNKPSAFVDLTFYRGLPSENPVEISQAKEKLTPVVDNAFKNSQLFSNHTFDPSTKAEQDYTIEVNIYNHGNEQLAFISGFITGFSLGVIPGAVTDNYTLELKAIDKDGRVLSELTNKDSITTWGGIWFIPVMSNTPDKAINGTLENQILTALKELIESGVMKYSYVNYLLSSA